MTQDEMIELAKQAGWQYAHGDSGYEPLWAFANLVAAKALAQHDSVQAKPEPEQETDKYVMDIECTKCGAKQSGILTVNTTPPQLEQKPVAWRWENGGKDKWLNKYIYLDNGAPDYPEECEPLYTIPPQRTWVGLTNNDLQPIAEEYRILFGSWVHDFARAIEAKLKEKNT